MALNYSTFTSALANFLVIPGDQAEFISAIPNIIDDAEQRSYRDLDLLSTVTGGLGNLTTGSRLFTAPVGGFGPFVVLQNVGVVTPLGADPLTTGTINPLLPISKEALGFLYPSNAGAGVPEYFAMFDQANILVGPWPDAAYQVVIAGTIRPPPLSVSNPTTFLSLYLPDVFLNAALVMGSGFLKDFGAATDDPKSGMTWQQKYDMAIKSASAEEARKKFQDQGWGGFSTGASATPPRT